jgi:nitric oxide reductase large subunit
METGSIGLIAAVIFLIVFVALAMIVLSFVKRTVKLAFRLAIVGVLLLIGVIGAASLWWFAGSSSGDKPRTAPVQRTR